MDFVAVDAPPGGHDRREQGPVLLTVPRLHLPADKPQLLRCRRLELDRRARSFESRFVVGLGFDDRGRLVLLVLVQFPA